ncbi:hypothetical protein Btru_057506 [Bulinus truncatus]|nr:hypothetical protein Btru_057506 [Bulinus truncatus]
MYTFNTFTVFMFYFINYQDIILRTKVLQSDTMDSPSRFTIMKVCLLLSACLLRQVISEETSATITDEQINFLGAMGAKDTVVEPNMLGAMGAKDTVVEPNMLGAMGAKDTVVEPNMLGAMGKKK